MRVTSSYSVFFAFPFDAATRPMYVRIMQRLKRHYRHRFRFVFGNSSVIKPSPRFVQIRMFKEQNNDLLKQFLSNITMSDIIVADLTNNNPNVHVELGIAITLSKNILRVSSRNLVEVGSDVRGYEINNYADENELYELIENYLERFLSIKQLPLSRKAGPFYQLSFKDAQRIRHSQVLPVTTMRDGALRVRFKFLSSESAIDWFGIYFRYGSHNPWAGLGYLLYVRKNGMLELAELPNIRIVKKKRCGGLALKKEYVLEFGVDGSNLAANLNGEVSRGFEVRGLNIQYPGNVGIGCFNSEVVFSRVETVCRDTINFFV